MKKILFITLASLVLASCNPTRKIKINELPTLNNVVTEIQMEYEKALKELQANRVTAVEITDAEITLKIAKESTAGGEIKVLIGKATKERTVSASTSVTYLLTKDANKTGSGKKVFVDQKLKDVIVAAAREFSSLDVAIGDLVKDSFNVDIIFSIQNTKGGGLSFEIQNVGADATGSWSRTVEHGMTLTFKKATVK
jgi:hypothetical protein